MRERERVREREREKERDVLLEFNKNRKSLRDNSSSSFVRHIFVFLGLRFYLSEKCTAQVQTPEKIKRASNLPQLTMPGRPAA